MTHYHRFKIVSETNSGVVEVCTQCKEKLITKKDKKGRVDNMAYLRSHIADTAQPKGPTAKVFAQVYGKPQV